MNGQTIGLYYRFVNPDGGYSDWMLYTDAKATANGKVTFNNVTAPNDNNFNVQYAIGPAANTGNYMQYTFESGASCWGCFTPTACATTFRKRGCPASSSAPSRC